MNITAIKTSTLQSLTRQLNDATTIAAKAQAAYNSYVNKAQVFKDQNTQANTDFTNVSAQWTQFLTLKSSLKALTETSDDCNLVAQATNNKIKRLVKKWEQVMQQTLEAADAIHLAYDYIKKRKASNPLISADLVNYASQAATNADAAVALVINSLTVVLNTLTVANQSTNSSNLTGLYIDQATAALLRPKPEANPADVTPSHVALEISLSNLLDQVTRKQASSRDALNDANSELATAKEALDSANAKVVSAQTALAAAQSAVNA